MTTAVIPEEEEKLYYMIFRCAHCKAILEITIQPVPQEVCPLLLSAFRENGYRCGPCHPKIEYVFTFKEEPDLFDDEKKMIGMQNVQTS